jgi:hypothetical protein
MSSPNLTLTATAPSVRKYQTLHMELHPIALYTLISLSSADLASIQARCESQCDSEQPRDNVLLAPQHSFSKQPLLAVFDYHLENGENEKPFSPIYFLVAVDEEFEGNGVLLVTLDDDEMECKVVV